MTVNILIIFLFNYYFEFVACSVAIDFALSSQDFLCPADIIHPQQVCNVFNISVLDITSIF